MSCSCPQCEGEMSYRYYKNDGQTWTLVGSGNTIKPVMGVSYACRAVMKEKRSLLSDVYVREFLLLFLLMDFDIVSP